MTEAIMGIISVLAGFGFLWVIGIIAAIVFWWFYYMTGWDF